MKATYNDFLTSNPNCSKFSSNKDAIAILLLTDGFTRTVIGRMIKSILDPFGYRPTVQKSFPKTCNVKYFSSASCYSLTGSATMKVAKYITEI